GSLQQDSDERASKRRLPACDAQSFAALASLTLAPAARLSQSAQPTDADDSSSLLHPRDCACIGCRNPHWKKEEESSHEQNSSVCFVMQFFVGRQSLPHPNRDARS